MGNCCQQGERLDTRTRRREKSFLFIYDSISKCWFSSSLLKEIAVVFWPPFIKHSLTFSGLGFACLFSCGFLCVYQSVRLLVMLYVSVGLLVWWCGFLRVCWSVAVSFCVSVYLLVCWIVGVAFLRTSFLTVVLLSWVLLFVRWSISMLVWVFCDSVAWLWVSVFVWTVEISQ